MKIKIIDNFDGNFELKLESKKILFELLRGEEFLNQVRQQVQKNTIENIKIEFTELLFKPVAYSKNTPKGMPSEFEAYHNSENYFIINVPPNFMFKAKIFNPNRLCAIYRKIL